MEGWEKEEGREERRRGRFRAYENHTRGHLTKIIREDLVLQSIPKGSDHLGFGKYGAKTYQAVLQMDRILDVAGEAEFIPGKKSGKQYDSRTDDKTHQTAQGGKTIRGNASIEITRSKTQDSQTERSHLKHSLGGRRQRAEGASQEVDGTNTATDGVFARAWGGEFGRELCVMADTCGETTMITLSNEETSWLEDHVRHNTAGLSWDRLTEQTRMTLAEVGAYTGATMYNTMEELAGTTNVIKLGGTGNHLTDTMLRRLLAKTREQERPRHWWLSLSFFR